MRNLKANLDMGRAILEWLSRREKRKRDILQCEMDMQVLQLRLRHDPKQVRLCGARPAESVCADPPTHLAQSLEAAAAVADGDGHKAKGEAGPLSHHGVGEAVGPNGQLLQSHGAKDRKRRREATQNRRATGGGGAGGGQEVEVYQPMPPPPEVQLLFLEPRLQVRVRLVSKPRGVPALLTHTRTCPAI